MKSTSEGLNVLAAGVERAQRNLQRCMRELADQEVRYLDARLGLDACVGQVRQAVVRAEQALDRYEKAAGR